MSADLFLKIISREIPANIIYETDTIIAFEDIHPVAPVHILIIPKEYIRTLNDVDEDHIYLLGEMMTAAQAIAKEQGIAEDGYRVILNCNEAGGQSVWHIHMHLMGGRRLNWPPG